MDIRKNHRLKHKSAGFSLVEVLVAMVILAVGLLGIATLQARSFKFNHESYARSQASVLAYEIIDRMRADSATDFTTANAGAVNCTLGNALAHQDPTADMALCLWLRDIQGDPGNAADPNDDHIGRLPGGPLANGTVTPNPNDTTMFDVTLTWLDREITTQADCVNVGIAGLQAGAAATRIWDAANNVCLFNQVWTVRR